MLKENIYYSIYSTFTKLQPSSARFAAADARHRTGKMIRKGEKNQELKYGIDMKRCSTFDYYYYY